jgi:hypothetical protein
MAAGGRAWQRVGADRTNNRYQVLDNNLKPIKEITNLGTGWTLCISPGPHQYVFHSNSNPNGNPPGSWDTTGEIYKTELDGTVLGKFGKPGKWRRDFRSSTCWTVAIPTRSSSARSSRGASRNTSCRRAPSRTSSR